MCFGVAIINRTYRLRPSLSLVIGFRSEAHHSRRTIFSVRGASEHPKFIGDSTNPINGLMNGDLADKMEEIKIKHNGDVAGYNGRTFPTGWWPPNNVWDYKQKILTKNNRGWIFMENSGWEGAWHVSSCFQPDWFKIIVRWRRVKMCDKG